MPNWCYNQVTISGGVNTSQVVPLFEKLIERQEKLDGNGVKPDFIPENSDPLGGNPYMFDLTIDNSDPDIIIITYNTKWSPNIDNVATIVDHFNIDKCEHRYDELGCGIYGASFFEGGTNIGVVDLSDDDMNQVEYDDDKDIYMFRGQEYECSDECYEIILEEKIKQENLDIWQ